MTLDFKIHFFRQYIFTAFENYFLQCSHIHTTYMCIFMFIFIYLQIIFQMLQCNHHEPMLVVSSIMTTTKITLQRQRKFLQLQKHLRKLQVWKFSECRKKCNFMIFHNKKKCAFSEKLHSRLKKIGLVL